MSDLKPHGVKILLGGEEHELLFTINGIDEIQSTMNLPLFEAMSKVAGAADGSTDPETLKAFRTILTILLQDAGMETDEKKVGRLVLWGEYRQIAGAILEAFGISLPEPDEDEDEADENGESPKATAGA